MLLAVTGSIAAFKAATLASDLVKRGYQVRVILSGGAARFVAPLTFEALTGQSVATDIWDEVPGSSRMGHLELARWADALIVAPASASAIATLALGLAGDQLGATALACRAPMIIAPAMETSMFCHPATQHNLELLRTRGATVVGPEQGRLASGEMGLGRMSEPEAILAVADRLLSPASDLAGRRVLVSAGPTFEAIDRVRFIGNRSSGKMGYAIAAEASARGAEVVLVSGPVALSSPAGAEVVWVESAAQMRDAILSRVAHMDAVVMAAAISDYRPANPIDGKIRRAGGLSLDLVPTGDISAAAVRAAPHAVHIGFALEAEDLLNSARRKLEQKGVDLVVANAVSEEHNPFGAETNRVFLVSATDTRELPEMSKRDVAARIVDELVQLLKARAAQS